MIKKLKKHGIFQGGLKTMNDTLNENRILIEALTTFGLERQSQKAIEELSELITAIAKYLHSDGKSKISALDNVVEEIEDVQIMLDQLKIAYGHDENIRREKLLRLRDEYIPKAKER